MTDLFIIDNKEMYHLGASIKDLDKKCFAINIIEIIVFNALQQKINYIFNRKALSTVNLQLIKL